MKNTIEAAPNSKLQELGEDPIISNGIAVVQDDYHFLRGNFKATVTKEYQSTKIKLGDVEIDTAFINLIKPTREAILPASEVDNSLAQKDNINPSQAINPYHTNSAESLFKLLESFSTVLEQKRSKIIEIKDDASLINSINWVNEEKSVREHKSLEKGIYKYNLFEYCISKMGSHYCARNSDSLLAHAQLTIDIIMRYAQQEKTLSVDDAADYHNAKYKALPILLSNPVLDQNWIKTDVASLLLSRTYSSNHEQTIQVVTGISDKLQAYSYKHDVMAFVTLGIAQGQDFPNAKHVDYVTSNNFKSPTTFIIERNDPLTIIHATNSSEQKEYFRDNLDIGGIYNTKYNSIVFTDEVSFIHESAHAVINLLFNNEANPYPANKGVIYSEYQEAEHDLLIKMLSRLDFERTTTLEEQSVESLKSILKSQTILDLLIFMYDPDKIENNKLDLKSKYFPNQEIEDFVQYFIEFANTKVAELKLTKSEKTLFQEIAALLHSPVYTPEVFDSEIIVRLPDLACQGVDAATMRYYFGKLEQFWDNHVHSRIAVIIEEHQSFCNIEDSCPMEQLLFMGNNSLSFDNCVVELL